MIDITIIRQSFPSCGSWRDLALLCKSNLNPRTLNVSRSFGRTSTYKNCVWWSEIVKFFEVGDLANAEAKEMAKNLEEMGFLKTRDDIDNPHRDWVMEFLI